MTNINFPEICQSMKRKLKDSLVTIKIISIRFVFKFFSYLSKSAFKATKDIDKNNENLLYVAQILVWVNYLTDELQKIKEELVICTDLSKKSNEELLKNQAFSTLDGNFDSEESKKELKKVKEVIVETLETDKKEMNGSKVKFEKVVEATKMTKNEKSSSKKKS